MIYWPFLFTDCTSSAETWRQGQREGQLWGHSSKSELLQRLQGHCRLSFDGKTQWFTYGWNIKLIKSFFCTVTPLYLFLFEISSFLHSFNHSLEDCTLNDFCDVHCWTFTVSPKRVMLIKFRFNFPNLPYLINRFIYNGYTKIRLKFPCDFDPFTYPVLWRTTPLQQVHCQQWSHYWYYKKVYLESKVAVEGIESNGM